MLMLIILRKKSGSNQFLLPGVMLKLGPSIVVVERGSYVYMCISLVSLLLVDRHECHPFT